jgi:ADP-heptose:LPS heptosyltransferase
LKFHGEIPGGKQELKPLLYPFNNSYPKKLWSKYRWWKNSNLKKVLPYLNDNAKWLTVIDRLGAPGDALISANVIRGIKEKFRKLKINLITPNPELVELDPNINLLNGKESFYTFDSSYWELIVRKETKENIISHNLKKLEIESCDYKAMFYLSDREKNWAEYILKDFPKPVLAICTQSKEVVKNWPLEYWTKLVQNLVSKFTLIQMGDDKEPLIEGLTRFAGKYSMRESAALMSKMNLFVGPDSLLMHIANGLDIPSLIIFGGSRPVDCFGYSENINFDSRPDCGPCWIHSGYESCERGVECMKLITVDRVQQSIYSHFK